MRKFNVTVHWRNGFVHHYVVYGGSEMKFEKRHLDRLKHDHWGIDYYTYEEVKNEDT